MKIDRLMGILTVLLQNDKVTAPQLAERFEVSRRTINRDIEDLCMAGVPIVTIPGAKGGISIAGGYTIDRSILSDEEITAISAGLLGLDSVSQDDRYRQLLDRLFSGGRSGGSSGGRSSVVPAGGNMMIDLSSWYKTTLAPKIAFLEEAINETREITFTYYSPKGEQQRRAEPYLLIFRWSSWYLWGFCLDRSDFRMFKLNRMDELKASGRSFQKRQVTLPDPAPDSAFPNTFEAKVLVEPEMKWRLIEEFGRESFCEREDGKLLFSFGFYDREMLFSWVMSFGDKAELLEPEAMREEFRIFIENICRRYTCKNET